MREQTYHYRRNTHLQAGHEVLKSHRQQECMFCLGLGLLFQL